MTDEGVEFETRTVRTIRGTESRTIAKWERDGWEFVSQSQGRVQTEITLRRPKPKSHTKMLVVGGAAVAVVLAVVITIGIINERSSAEPAATSASSPSERPTSSAETRSPEPSAIESPEATEPATVVITAENNAEFAALLVVSDYCDDSVAAFAEKYRGETVAFDGYVGAMNPHGDTNTRYDILIIPGNFNESAAGPSFQFGDVNTTFDLHYTGEVPDSIGVGTNLHVTGEVAEYSAGGCQFFLEPVATAFR